MIIVITWIKYLHLLWKVMNRKLKKWSSVALIGFNCYLKRKLFYGR